MNRISDYSKQTLFHPYGYLTIVLTGLKACSLIATNFSPGPELVYVAVSVCYMLYFCNAAGSLNQSSEQQSEARLVCLCLPSLMCLSK